MAKFCGNCGTQLEDSAKICGNCGMPLDGTANSIPKSNRTSAKKHKKTKRTVRNIVVLAIFAVVAIIVFSVVSQYTGYNGLLRKTMNAYEKYDIDMLISLSSDMYFYGDEDWVEKYFKYSVGNDLDSIESAVGHSYKLSYEVNEIYTLSERKFNERLSQIEYAYSEFDVSTIEKIVIANLAVTAKQGSKSVNSDVNIVMSKENGKWRLLYIE